MNSPVGKCKTEKRITRPRPRGCQRGKPKSRLIHQETQPSCPPGPPWVLENLGPSVSPRSDALLRGSFHAPPSSPLLRSSSAHPRGHDSFLLSARPQRALPRGSCGCFWNERAAGHRAAEKPKGQAIPPLGCHWHLESSGRGRSCSAERWHGVGKRFHSSALTVLYKTTCQVLGTAEGRTWGWGWGSDSDYYWVFQVIFSPNTFVNLHLVNSSIRCFHFFFSRAPCSSVTRKGI